MRSLLSSLAALAALAGCGGGGSSPSDTDSTLTVRNADPNAAMAIAFIDVTDAGGFTDRLPDEALLTYPGEELRFHKMPVGTYTITVQWKGPEVVGSGATTTKVRFDYPGEDVAIDAAYAGE